MSDFTVIGYYDETGQRYNGHHTGNAWTDAVDAAIAEAGMDLVIVEVITGHHMGLAESQSVEYACDWPGVWEDNGDDLPGTECVPGQTHLSSCDEDGYCNHCGSQESLPRDSGLPCFGGDTP